MGFGLSIDPTSLATLPFELDEASKQRAMSDSQFNRNIELQKEFAQNGIRWKVEDAKAAGIHPLYALGASTTSFAPVSVGDVPGSSGVIGQNINRSVQARFTLEERRKEDALDRLRLERAQLENENIKNQVGLSRIALQNAMTPPPTPALRGQEPGVIPDYTLVQTDRGLKRVPSSEMTPRIQGSFWEYVDWWKRNRLLPAFSPPPPQSEEKAPVGTEWHWNPVMSEYVPVPVGGYGKTR